MTNGNSGVSKILVVDASGGNDFVQIDDGVLANADISGGDGDDTLIYMGSGTATLNGGNGNDTIVIGGGPGSTANGGPGNDNLVGGTGNDTLNGGTGDDVLHGAGGNDIVVGGPGTDQIFGDDGNDTLVWNVGDGVDSTIDGGVGSADRFQVNLTAGNDTATFDRATSGTGFRTITSGVTLGAVNIENADLFAQGGADSVTVNHLGSSLLRDIFVYLGSGDAALDSVTVNGSDSADSYTVSVAGTTVNIGRASAETVHVNDAGSADGGANITLNLQGGADTATVQQTLAGTTTFVNGQDGNDTIRVAPGSNVNGVAGKLVVDGGNNIDTLEVDDLDNDGAAMFLTSSRIWGLGMPGSDAVNNGISYTGVEAINAHLGARADTVNVLSTNSTTVTTINTGASTTASNTVNVGSNAPSATGDVDSIAGKLIVNGQATGTGADTLNVFDTDNNGAETAFVSATRVWGLGMPGSDASNGGITYSGLENLNLNLGARADTVNVLSTASGNVTTVNTGVTAANVVNVSSAAPGITGDVNSIAGKLVINGQSPADTVNVTDKDNVRPETGFLTASRIWGLDMPGSSETTGGITYLNVKALNIALGARADTFNVRSTNGSTVTTIATGTGTADNIVNVGSAAPATGGDVNSVAGLLVVIGESTGTSDTLNVDDTGDTGLNSGSSLRRC